MVHKAKQVQHPLFKDRAPSVNKACTVATQKDAHQANKGMTVLGRSVNRR